MEISGIQHGAPADKRSSPEADCYELLDRLGTEYARVDHDTADTMEDCIAIEKVLGAKICKNLFLTNRQKTNFYLLLMPGDKEFRTKDLSAQINSARLSFAGAESMQQLLGVTPGSVSVLGLMNDTEHIVTLLIDEDVLRDEYIGVHPCLNRASLRLKTSDLLEKILPATGHDYTKVVL